MEDPQPPPSTQPKKKLLFKRTIQRKSAEKPKEDDDGLSLFSRSNEFFPTVIKDREREAAEKVKAEKERKEKLQRAQREKEEALRSQNLFRPKKEDDEDDEDETHSAKKRRRSSLSDNDNDDDVFTTTKPHKSRKSSTVTPISPSTKRESFGRDSVARTPRSTRSSRASRRHNANSSAAAVITLNSSDDEDTEDIKPLKNSFSPLGHKPSPAAKRQRPLEDESDLEFDTGDSPLDGVDGADADFNCYIQGALERAEKRKRERLERETAGSGATNNNNNINTTNTSAKNGSAKKPSAAAGAGAAAGNDEPAIQILISSVIEGIAPIVFKRKLHQPLAVVHSTWVEQQVSKHAPLPRAVLHDMFFTWRGDKVYQTSTLETLGIRPDASGDGSLWSSSSSSRRWGESDPPEGYHGRDKVLFEAWTQDLYEEYQRRRERERRIARGELVSDDDEEDDGAGGDGGGGNNGEAGAEGRGRGRSREPSEQEQQAQKKVRIILKARGMDPENVKVRPNTTIAVLAVVFKRLKKLPAENTVEFHWDGEVLDPDSTVEDAEMEDMDSIEVHIK